MVLMGLPGEDFLGKSFLYHFIYSFDIGLWNVRYFEFISKDAFKGGHTGIQNMIGIKFE